MPFTGALAGLLEAQQFDTQQKQAQANLALTAARTEEEKQVIASQKMQMDLARQRQEALSSFFANGMINDGIQKNQQAQSGKLPSPKQQQKAAQVQWQNMDSPTRMETLGRYMMSKPGLQEEGMKYLKEAADMRKGQAMAQKEASQVNIANAKETGRQLSGLSENPTPGEYKGVMEEIYNTTGKVPDWYTGDFQHDKQFIDDARRAFTKSRDSSVMHMQNGMTANAFVQQQNSLARQAQAQTKPMIDVLQKTSQVRTLLQMGLPIADQQVKDAMVKLFSGAREGMYLYKQNSNFGDLWNRFSNTVSGVVQGRLSEEHRKEIAQMIDQMDNQLFVPEFERVSKRWRTTAEKEGFDPDIVAPFDPTDIHGGATAQQAQKNLPKQGASGYPSVHTIEDYAKIPKGAMYTDPQGNVRRKP